MEHKKTDIKSCLKQGEVILGCWNTVSSASLINVISKSGLDFVIIDTEHGPCGFQALEDMVRAAEVGYCAPFVRVSKNDDALILHALDSGASGVLIPHISSKKDAEAAICYSKYYPEGQRGFSPFTRAGGYSPANIKTHCESQNNRTILALMLEGKDGIGSLEDILGISNIARNVDVIYIGAYDLSQALGVPGEVDRPEIRKHLEDCVRKIRKAGIAAGGYVAKDSADMEWMCRMGMQFITLLPDCTIISNAFKSLANDFGRVKSGLGR